MHCYWWGTCHLELAEFQSYWMLWHLKDVFSKVPTLIMSATITPNILDYIWVFLKLLPPSQIYRLSLDRPNLKYMVCFFWKLGFQDLAFLIPKDSLVGLIPKTIVFVNKIENAVRLERYLQSRLPDCIRNGKQAFVIIQSIIFNLDVNTRIRVIEDLQYGNAQICVSTKCASMGINILNIIYVV